MESSFKPLLVVAALVPLLATAVTVESSPGSRRTFASTVAATICPSSWHWGHPCALSPNDLRCRVAVTHGSHLKGQLC